MKFLGILLMTFVNAMLSGGMTIDLCAYFVQGATCNAACEYEAVHSWGIPLCLHAPETTQKCCIPLTHPLLKYMKPKTTTTSPITTTALTQAALQASSSTPPPRDSAASRDSHHASPPRACGEPTRSARVRRVIGGARSAAGTWPWQVALQSYTGDYLCGGVIVDKNWILTAAHCFKPSESEAKCVRVYAGNNKLQYDTGRRNFTKVISKIVKHPDFRANVETISTDPVTGRKSRYTRHLDDLALLQLETSLDFTDDIQPVCLPGGDDAGAGEEETREPAATGKCWVAGWGEGRTGTTSDDLREVSGSRLDHEECGKKWGTSFNDDVVCFGDKGHGPCKGDSGGGMFCRHDDGRYYVSGIVSWGRDDCAHDTHPSVLMNVQSYRPWIDHVIEEHAPAE